MIQPCFNCGDPTEYSLVGTAEEGESTGVYSIPLCMACDALLADEDSNDEDGLLTAIVVEIIRQIKSEDVPVI